MNAHAIKNTQSRTLKPSGFSLVELLVALGATAILALISAFVINRITTSNAQAQSDFWLEIRRDEIFQYLRTDQSWGGILTENSSMTCLDPDSALTCPSGEQPLKLNLGTGFVLDGQVATLGLSNEGSVCNQFSDTVFNGSCPFGIKLSWSKLCPDASCKNPEAKLEVRFRSSQSQPKDLSKFDIRIVRTQKLNTAMQICVQVGGIWAAGNCDISQVLKQCPAGQFLTGFDGAGVPICTAFNLMCGSPSCGVAFNMSGEAVCLPALNQNCVGTWTPCSNTCGTGTQTYQVTQNRRYCGTSCPYTNGSTQSCTDNSGCAPPPPPPPPPSCPIPVSDPPLTFYVTKNGWGCEGTDLCNTGSGYCAAGWDDCAGNHYICQ